MKEKILKACRSIPTANLANYVKKQIVTLQELSSAGLDPTRVEEVRNHLRSDDHSQWDTAAQIGSAKALQTYLFLYPDGLHRDEALAALAAADEQEWNEVEQDLGAASLENYLAVFSNGAHADEARELLADLPWLEAKRSGTIRDMETYMQEHPGIHDDEARNVINGLLDDHDWVNACRMSSTEAYRHYVEQHPDGRHASEAQERIQAAAGRDAYVDALSMDPNAYSATQIQTAVDNNVITWDNVLGIFGDRRTEAIQSFRAPSELPYGNPPQMLQPNSTEVYFWGTPSSGKTCALGSIISSAQSSGIFEPLPCRGYDYMIRLSNIFRANGFCVFPTSTDVSSIQEMMLCLSDAKGKKHRVTLVDLAGELFRAVYNKQNGLFLDEESERTLATAMSYLKDRRNNKIHFFVVEYGAHEREWDGLRMVNYLDNMVGYLKSERIFRSSTVGVYVLVTKCDRMNVPFESRPECAFRYVSEEMPSFWNTLQDTCNRSGVRDLGVLSYSVGDVFAQQLCHFNGSDTEKVIRRLLAKTKAEGSWLDWLRA